ncbi:hypothetical protein JCM16358_12900 [Halanaerocella petrolearia]
MGKYILMFLSSLVMSLLFTPLAEKLAYYVGAVDHPNHRKVHEGSMPRLGGVAIYLAFLVNSLLFIEVGPTFEAILLGSVIIVTVGIIDDIRGLDAEKKLTGQVLATLPILLHNLQIDYISHPLSGLILTGYLAIPITILWVVGLINAVNLIDGLDGLAGGVATISALSIAVICLAKGNLVSLGLALILAGSTLGFLKYNFNPAEIFMGDSGSMFLGYALAVISLTGMVKSATAITIFAPILVLGVPIFDTSFAFIRRMLIDKHPFQADKEHLHHRFLRFGLNQKQTVLTIYLVALIFGMTAILLVNYNSLLVLLLSSLILTVLFFWLKEFGIIRLGSTAKAEPIEVLGEIRHNLVELEEVVEDELELAGFHQEIGQLEELMEKVPSFVYDTTSSEVTVVKEEETYRSLRDRVYWLVEIIDHVIDNYQHNDDNLNYIFQEEKSNLLTIHDNLNSNL